MIACYQLEPLLGTCRECKNDVYEDDDYYYSYCEHRE